MLHLAIRTADGNLLMDAALKRIRLTQPIIRACSGVALQLRNADHTGGGFLIRHHLSRSRYGDAAWREEQISSSTGDRDGREGPHRFRLPALGHPLAAGALGVRRLRPSTARICASRRCSGGALLQGLIGDEGDAIQFSHHVAGLGSDFYKAVEKLGLEGMVSKRTDAPYHSGAALHG